jgi:hypothetical protein
VSDQSAVAEPEKVLVVDDCKHERFEAGVAVQRFENGKFLLELVVKCRDCHRPFQFVGAPLGPKWTGPSTNILRQQLMCPVEPGAYVTTAPRPM